jgi:hypothetical protein
MELEHKVLSCPETGEDYLAVIARGQVDAGAITEVFLSIAEITESVGACLVLVDFRFCEYDITYPEIDQLFREVKPALRLMHNRIALISAPAVHHYDQLFMLSVYLLDHGVEADAFCQANRALQWLEQKKQRPILH